MSDHDDDHRNLARRLDLWHFRDDAPGMVFWQPRGLVLYRLLEAAVREVTSAQGYEEVRTPQILRRPVWEGSGHWEHFHEGMLHLADQSVEAAVKPVSCPGHALLVQKRVLSYRDLPLRLAELGVVHRDEPSGTLHGLMRLRQFTQDDGHIFCLEEQAEDEALAFCQAVPAFYRAFGLEDVSVALSTRPERRAGDDALWDRAEATLASVLRRLDQPYTLQPGAGAFYGPKIEYSLRDRAGNAWQCGTIQLDLVMPRRFDLRYVDASGGRAHPVMLHRALYGSLERFLAIVLERHGAALPAWLAPVQAVVLPVGEEQGAARAVERELRRAGLRVAVDGEETLAKRIARAHAQAIPFQAVVGAREAAAGTVALRRRDGQETLSVADATRELLRACAAPAFAAEAQPPVREVAMAAGASD
jgi:threonyl-tRNA synthetase